MKKLSLVKLQLKQQHSQLVVSSKFSHSLPMFSAKIEELNIE